MEDDEEQRIRRVRQHFEDKGYRVHSGLQFGCELVLYADDPSKVHSDYAVHIIPSGMYAAAPRRLLSPVISDGSIDWLYMQTLVRSMSDIRKTLILAHLQQRDGQYHVDEIAMTTEHAPFRHKKRLLKESGTQHKGTRKRKEILSSTNSTNSGQVDQAQNM